MNFYLYFDVETGDILSCSNELRTDQNYITIEREMYLQFANADLNISHYMVVPSIEEGETYTLKERHRSSLEFDVDKSIHKFVKVKQNTKENVFVIQQTQGCWKVYTNLSSNYLKFLTQNEKYVNSIKQIYITEEDNPNILLDVLKMPIKDVLFSDKYEFVDYNADIAKRSDISLYCGTNFENFVHEVGDYEQQI